MTVPANLHAAIAGILGSLNDGVTRWLQLARPSALQRGQSVLRAGERWQHFCWVERGLLRMYYLGLAGEETNKSFYFDGATFWPITPLMRAQVANFHIEAIEDTTLWTLPIGVEFDIVREHPQWMRFEHQALTALLDQKMLREQQFLQLSAKQRYQLLLQQHPDWVTRIPLRHLASYLGMTDVSLSRIRAELRVN